jgi:hypothetical protein
MAFALSLRAQVRAQDRVLTASEPNATLFGVLLCLPTAPALPLERENGDFGRSPIYGQLSDKPRLAFVSLHGERDMKHNRDREIKRRAASCRPAGLRSPYQFVGDRGHDEARKVCDREHLRAGKARATLKPQTVQEIAQSILEVGQQAPILVRRYGDRLVLIHGLHRLEACKALGEETIYGYLVQAVRH